MQVESFTPFPNLLPFLVENWMKLLVSSSESFRGKKSGYVLNAGEKWFYLHLLGSTLLVNIPIQNRMQYPHSVFFAAWVMHA